MSLYPFLSVIHGDKNNSDYLKLSGVFSTDLTEVIQEKQLRCLNNHLKHNHWYFNFLVFRMWHFAYNHLYTFAHTYTLPPSCLIPSILLLPWQLPGISPLHPLTPKITRILSIRISHIFLEKSKYQTLTTPIADQSYPLPKCSQDLRDRLKLVPTATSSKWCHGNSGATATSGTFSLWFFFLVSRLPGRHGIPHLKCTGTTLVLTAGQRQMRGTVKYKHLPIMK